jgi:glucose-6-phosphate 1-dehydrogenase
MPKNSWRSKGTPYATSVSHEKYGTRFATRPARGQHGMLAVSDTNRDALVIFGVTGDLAFKQIFPALQNLARQQRLEIPVLGVAREGWSLERLKERTLFAREDTVEAAWALIDDLRVAAKPPEPYKPGSWGPTSAERLAADIGGWHNAVERC